MRLSCSLLAALILPWSLSLGCQSKAPPTESAELRRDYAQECREAKEGACAKACFEVDAAFCEDALHYPGSGVTINDALRVELLERACTNGSAKRCAELGGMLLGRDKRRASWAYERFCADQDAGSDCLSPRQKWIEEAEMARAKCDAGDASACVDLGETYWAADNCDDATEAFARTCELRGFDNEQVTPDVQREVCRTGMPCTPYKTHPGVRGRCGEEVIYFVPRGLARAHFNSRPYASPALSVDAPAPAITPKKARQGSTKLRIGPITQLLTDYSKEALVARLDEMHDELEYCASETPEIKNRLGILATFAVDKVGVPAFVQVQRRSDEGGHAPQEAWRRLVPCFMTVFKNRTYPAPLADKGVRLIIPITLNPNAKN